MFTFYVWIGLGTAPNCSTEIPNLRGGGEIEGASYISKKFWRRSQGN